MSTTISTRVYSEFLVKWPGTPKELDLAQLAMILDASEAVLKTKFPGKEISPNMITGFSNIVAMQVFK